MFRAFPLALALLLLGSLAQSAVGQLAISLAAPKTIAIVNLSDAPGALKAADMVRGLLDHIPELRPNTPGDLARALEGALPAGGPDQLVLTEAKEALAAADEAFAGFQSNETRSQLERARRLLFTLPPSKAAISGLADTSFRMALLHLRDENRGLAMDELQLLHRLDERTSIDPVRYPPDVVRAFKAALRNAPTERNAKLHISTTYDGAPVFVDGVAVGSAPVTTAVTAGVHIVAVAAPQYQAAAQKVVIDGGASKELKIDLEPRRQTTRALELRFAARQAGLHEDDLRGAAARVWRLLGSDAVLVISSKPGADSKPVAQLYLPTLDRLSFERPIDSQLQNIFGLVIEVPRPKLIDEGGKASQPRWYKNPFIVGLAAVLATAAGGGAIYTVITSDEPPPPVRLDPSWF